MMRDRYTLREELDKTWSVVDVFTDWPAVLAGFAMIGLTLEAGGEMRELLNRMDRERRMTKVPGSSASA